MKTPQNFCGFMQMSKRSIGGMLLKRRMENGDWGMGNGEWGMGKGNGKLKMGK